MYGPPIIRQARTGEDGNRSQQQPATRYVLCGPGTAMASVRPSRDAAYIWTTPDFRVRELMAELSSRDLHEIKGPKEAIEWEQGSYRLSGVLILRPSQPAQARAGRRSFEVVLASQPASGGLHDKLLVGLESAPPR